MNLKKGSPLFGILCGLFLAGAGVLVMSIGFWKAMLLIILFLIGYFLGSIENKEKYLKEKINKIVPRGEKKVIDLRSEIVRDQKEQLARMENVQMESDENVEP